MHGDQRSLAFVSSAEGVAVFDANAIIDLKQVRVRELWDLFLRLQQRVGDGDICIPREVIDEVGRVRHPDGPGTWAEGMRGRQHYPIEADPKIIKNLLRTMPNLLDSEKDHEDADPYVVALAIQLGKAGHDHSCLARCEVPTRQAVRARSMRGVGYSLYAHARVARPDRRTYSRRRDSPKAKALETTCVQGRSGPTTLFAAPDQPSVFERPRHDVEAHLPKLGPTAGGVRVALTFEGSGTRSSR